MIIFNSCLQDTKTDEIQNSFIDQLMINHDQQQVIQNDQSILEKYDMSIDNDDFEENLQIPPIIVDISNRAPLNSIHPGGWIKSSFVFSQARIQEDLQDNEWVQLGWFNLHTDVQFTACGSSGPKVERIFYRWSHSNYPVGNCDQDIKDQVHFRRWDHSSVDVNECPGLGAWTEANAQISQREFLYDCPAHLPASFGNRNEQITYEGNYIYDSINKTLILRYAVPSASGVICKKEYYHHLIHDQNTKLLAMKLDGEKSSDLSVDYRGLGGSHGYAYGSQADISIFVSLDQAMLHINQPEKIYVSDAWRFRENRDGEAPLEHYQINQPLNDQPILCKPNVYFHHSCESTNQYPPFLHQCAPSKTAYLRFWIDPFPELNSRENLYWAWHAHHAPNWTGCYHLGSHSNPLLQIIDSDGIFRGYVGIEIQRSAQTIGINQTPIDAYQKTDYRVFRWVEKGFEEN